MTIQHLVENSSFLFSDSEHFGRDPNSYEIESDIGIGDDRVIVVSHPDWNGRVALTNGDPVVECCNEIEFAELLEWARDRAGR